MIFINLLNPSSRMGFTQALKEMSVKDRNKKIVSGR
jgi:hypothetical protein